MYIDKMIKAGVPAPTSAAAGSLPAASPAPAMASQDAVSRRKPPRVKTKPSRPGVLPLDGGGGVGGPVRPGVISVG